MADKTPTPSELRASAVAERIAGGLSAEDAEAVQKTQDTWDEKCAEERKKNKKNVE